MAKIQSKKKALKAIRKIIAGAKELAKAEIEYLATDTKKRGDRAND